MTCSTQNPFLPQGTHRLCEKTELGRFWRLCKANTQRLRPARPTSERSRLPEPRSFRAGSQQRASSTSRCPYSGSDAARCASEGIAPRLCKRAGKQAAHRRAAAGPPRSLSHSPSITDCVSCACAGHAIEKGEDLNARFVNEVEGQRSLRAQCATTI